MFAILFNFYQFQFYVLVFSFLLVFCYIYLFFLNFINIENEKNIYNNNNKMFVMLIGLSLRPEFINI